MTLAAFQSRLAEGSPLTLGELASFLGFSREHVRKLCNERVIKTTESSRPRAWRRVTVEEAERFARAEGRL